MLTEKTVKHHMTQIMSKLCVRNRVELALHFANKATLQQKAGLAHSR
jgi:DNA-binding NarL/FixJ family response regulator